MKIPITDTFILAVFEKMQSIDRAYDFFAPRTLQDAVCPELFQLRREYARKIAKRKFSQLLYHVKKKGYIKIVNLQTKQGVVLTQKGVKKALRAQLNLLNKKKRSDAKWIMVIFDIPEKKRTLRSLLREILCELGYQKLQGSVWVSPYDVYEKTEKFIRAYALDLYVKIFLVEKLEM